MKQAMRFLGNASSAISSERRRRVADYLNNNLRPLIEEEEYFQNDPPFLFGKDFKREVRDHVESIKSLRKLTPYEAELRSHPFFDKATPTIRLLVGEADPIAKAVVEKNDINHIAARGRKTTPEKGKPIGQRLPYAVKNVAVETVHYYAFPNLHLVMPLLKQNKILSDYSSTCGASTAKQGIKGNSYQVSIEELAPGWMPGSLKKTIGK